MNKFYSIYQKCSGGQPKIYVNPCQSQIFSSKRKPNNIYIIFAITYSDMYCNNKILDVK